MDITKLVAELNAISQTGLNYCKDVYDQARFERINELASIIATNFSTRKYDEIKEIFAHDVGYKTPKVDIRGAVFKDNKILMVKETSDGLWSIPGGWADINLSPAENTIKEIYEESGYSCKALKLIGVYDNYKQSSQFVWPHIYKMVFHCEIISGESIISIETSEVRFFDQKELPELSVNRINAKQINDCFKHKYDQQCKAEFE